MSSARAEQKARELLPRVLTPGEWSSYRRWGKIRITGSEGGKYEIKTGSYVGNVVNLQPVTLRRMVAPAGSGLCAHPSPQIYDSRTGSYSDQIPPTDAFITQILMIKANEKGFLQIANKYY